MLYSKQERIAVLELTIQGSFKTIILKVLTSSMIWNKKQSQAVKSKMILKELFKQILATSSQSLLKCKNINSVKKNVSIKATSIALQRILKVRAPAIELRCLMMKQKNNFVHTMVPS